jgi:hypothetical protein
MQEDKDGEDNEGEREQKQVPTLLYRDDRPSESNDRPSGKDCADSCVPVRRPPERFFDESNGDSNGDDGGQPSEDLWHGSRLLELPLLVRPTGGASAAKDRAEFSAQLDRGAASGFCLPRALRPRVRREFEILQAVLRPQQEMG